MWVPRDGTELEKSELGLTIARLGVLTATIAFVKMEKLWSN